MLSTIVIILALIVLLLSFINLGVTRQLISTLSMQIAQSEQYNKTLKLFFDFGAENEDDGEIKQFVKLV